MVYVCAFSLSIHRTKNRLCFSIALLSFFLIPIERLFLVHVRVFTFRKETIKAVLQLCNFSLEVLPNMIKIFFFAYFCVFSSKKAILILSFCKRSFSIFIQLIESVH